MIFRHIGYNSHIAGPEAKSGTQHAAAGAFQHCKIHGWVTEYKFGTFWPGSIAFYKAFFLNINTIGSSKANPEPHVFYHVRNQAGSSSFSVGTGYGNNRNTWFAVGRE